MVLTKYPVDQKDLLVVLIDLFAYLLWSLIADFHLKWCHIKVETEYRPRNKNFEFTKIMKCGMFESWITAQEKFKKILGQKNPRSYFYYHCSKCHDHKCTNPMIREDALILQLLEMLDDIDINTISVWDSLNEEIRRYNLLQSQLLKKDSRDVLSAKQINLRDYMK